MIPTIRFGRTELNLTRIALGGYPFGGVNRARGWDPLSRSGRAAAIETVHAALDTGINYIDTAPSYGRGNSESIIGEATEGRRDRFALATKVGYRLSADKVTAGVEESLKRLRTDSLDVLQLHGGMFSDQDIAHILTGGPLEAMRELQRRGLVRFVGFSCEEPWTARPLIATGEFDVMQIRYNLIYQGAALHALNEARDADMGVAVMRPMTSGMLQRLAEHLAPRWRDAHDLYETALKFVLSDSRVHVANVGMRWPAEVRANAALAETFRPEYDMADLPRSTAGIYQDDDERNPDEPRQE